MEDTKYKVKRVMDIISERSRGKELGTGRKKKRKHKEGRNLYVLMKAPSYSSAAGVVERGLENRRWQTGMQIG